MQKLFLPALFAAVALSAGAQTMTEWDDVSVTSVNRETATDLALPLTDISQIEDVAGKSQSPYYNVSSTKIK